MITNVPILADGGRPMIMATENSIPTYINVPVTKRDTAA